VGATTRLRGWFTDTDHKAIALRYVKTAFVFFVFGGIEAVLMRIQLLKPNNHFLSPDQYNQIFTMHGTTMMFLFAVPIMTAMGIYLVPLMVGARDVAFPRLNLFGYFIYLIGGIFIYTGFILNTGPDAGWFAYVPLSGPGFSPGKRVDIWAQMITFTEISSLVGAIVIIGTAFKMRAPGLSINRWSLFIWAQVVTSFMIIFAMPSVMLASSFLASDRLIDTHFLIRRKVAMRFCINTCSGSSDIRRSTSSSFPRSGLSRRSSSPSRAGRSLVTSRSSCR
jgi:cytochrome c oxidase subunit 1